MEQTYGPPARMNNTHQEYHRKLKKIEYFFPVSLYKFIMMLSLGNCCFADLSDKTDKRKKITFCLVLNTFTMSPNSALSKVLYLIPAFAIFLKDMNCDDY